jgi:hypothetical protein
MKTCSSATDSDVSEEPAAYALALERSSSLTTEATCFSETLLTPTKPNSVTSVDLINSHHKILSSQTQFTFVI